VANTGRLDRRHGQRRLKLDQRASVQEITPKKAWSLNPGAFERLLNWLDEGASSNGERYLEMRRRLAGYFERKNSSMPDELADETLNRVARRLEEEGTIKIDIPAKYCYIVARLIFLEHLRTHAREQGMRAEIREKPPAEEKNQTSREIEERMLNCLEQCAGKLDSANKKLIFSYYVGQERVKIDNRRALAKALGITINALSIRACRIREKLELCVRQCVGTP
jgi:DNA-directed RNA polymerase specialized sigma24 family protein